MMRLAAHRLVFIDESGTNTRMTQTFIAGLRCQGLTAPFVIDKPMTRRLFEAYVEAQRAPSFEAAIKARGAWMLFLPPYSPDLNPIEMASPRSRAICVATPCAPSMP